MPKRTDIHKVLIIGLQALSSLARLVNLITLELRHVRL